VKGFVPFSRWGVRPALITSLVYRNRKFNRRRTGLELLAGLLWGRHDATTRRVLQMGRDRQSPSTGSAWPPGFSWSVSPFVVSLRNICSDLSSDAVSG
jgi:hypothetical protein